VRPAEEGPELLGRLMEQGRCGDVVRASGGAPLAPGQKVLVAVAAARTGDLALARRLATEARTALQAQGESPLLCRALNVLGGVAFERGRLAEATAWFEQAGAMATRLHEPVLWARATTNLASLRQAAGEATAAAGLYRDAMARFEDAGDLRGRAQVHHNLAVLHRRARQSAAAAAEATRAAELAREAGDAGLVGMALTLLAEIRVDTGEGGVDETLERARALATAAEDPLGEVEADRVRARWHLREGRTPEAVADAESARARAKRLGALLARGECAAVSAEAWSRTDQPLVADARRDEAELLIELLGVAPAPLPPRPAA
jgi:ATP/maltotriose-dependent transcriptional regulator MalT